MSALDLASRFGTALGLGLLLGLERERSSAREEKFAGVRTMAIVALLGATSTYLQVEQQLAWAVTACFVAVAGLTLLAYAMTSRREDAGATTEFTVLVTFLIGVLCALDQTGLATGLAVTVLLLLSIKGWSHELAAHIEPADVEATLKFAIITTIVLPLLPDHSYGPAPLDVVNPYTVWLMVVLISGLNFASYVLVKLVGPEHGIGLTGLLGGLVSSTAVTLGFAQRSRQEPELSQPLSLGILVAWTVMFVRVLVAVAVISPLLARRLGLGIGLMGVVSLAACGLLFWRHRAPQTASVHSGSNPFELGQAVKFGLVFGVVTFAAKAAQVYLGAAGLYLAGALAGLTDVDAIALSMANLAAGDASILGPAARTILIAVLANTLVKSGIAVVMGAPELRRSLLPLAGLLVASGAVAVFLVG